MLGALAELHLSHAEGDKRFRTTAAVKDAMPKGSISLCCLKKPMETQAIQAELDHFTPFLATESPSLGIDTLTNQKRRKNNLSAYFAGPSVTFCLLPTAKWWAVSRWTCWSWSELLLYSFPGELKKKHLPASQETFSLFLSPWSYGALC